jgi:hypothetical protein
MNHKASRVFLAVTVLAMASLACNALSGLGGDRPLLEDNFSGSRNWGVGTDADSSVEYANDGLRMQVFRENYIVWSNPGDTSYENIRVEVTVKNNNTDSTTAFGIICHQQSPITDSYYYLVITPAGEYAIAKASLAASDVFLTNNDQWGYSDAIAQNADSYKVGADCGNGRLTLYVDGQQIDSVADSTYTSGGVGLQIWSGEGDSTWDVTFDDFVVTKLAE